MNADPTWSYKDRAQLRERHQKSELHVLQRQSVLLDSNMHISSHVGRYVPRIRGTQELLLPISFSLSQSTPSHPQMISAQQKYKHSVDCGSVTIHALSTAGCSIFQYLHLPIKD